MMPLGILMKKNMHEAQEDFNSRDFDHLEKRLTKLGLTKKYPPEELDSILAIS